MSIKHKDWGYEEVVERNPQHMYLVKWIVLRGGKSTTIHAHERKDETLTVFEGEVIVDLYSESGLLEDTKHLSPGQSLTIYAKKPHRMRCANEYPYTKYLESSRVEDTAYRINSWLPETLESALFPTPEGYPGIVAACLDNMPVDLGMLSKENVQDIKDAAEIFNVELKQGVKPHTIYVPREQNSNTMQMRKPDMTEHVFIHAGRVYKWFKNHKRCAEKILRATTVLKDITPHIDKAIGGWFSYKLVEGEVVGRLPNLTIKSHMHQILSDAQYMWDRGRCLRGSAQWCNEYYYERTLERMKKMKPDLCDIFDTWYNVNSEQMIEHAVIRDTWHGDFTLHNLILDGNTRKVVWIDWHDVMHGDVYCDLARMLMSIMFDTQRKVHLREDPTDLLECFFNECNRIGFDTENILRVQIVVLAKMTTYHVGKVDKMFTEVARQLMLRPLDAYREAWNSIKEM